MYQEAETMTEGRKCQILLPDDRALEFLIQPKLFTHELLDIVASHFKLKEKDYFGLAFQDETGHWNWLQQDKKVLDHDLPRKQSSNLVIAFLVKYYVETITQLRDTATVELFYLCAKQSVFKGQIECDSETVFELAAHVLQASLGDYVDDETTKADLKKLPLLTTSALKEHLSIQYCEERVIHYYKKISGTARGLAIVNYMTIVESLPTYGIHYFEVKDKKDIPWWLGISNKGIGVYDKQDKNVPRRLLVWKSLENLYYRDRKFSIEVHDPKRVIHALSSFNLYEDAIRETPDESDELSAAISDPTTQVSVSRRTFGPGNVNVHAWFGATPQLTKCVWSMAVAQHQFYHERKTSKATLPTVRSASELATALSTSTSSLTGSLGSDISRSGSSASLPSLGASTFNLNFDPADTAKVQREMYLALKARREQLEEALKKRTEELKMLCIKEGELTGVLPAETPLGPGEVPPQIRRRVGTAFSLSTYMVPDQNDQSEDETKKLQLELELQKQITNAAHKLASDKSVSRFVRKQRRHSFMKAQNKLKDMERKLSEHRKGSIPESPASSGKFDDSDVISPSQSPLVPRGPRSNFKQHEDRPGVSESSTHRSSPVSKHVEREIVSVTLPVPQPSSNSDDLYKANAVYSNQYRNHTYPTISGRSTAAGNQSDHVSKGTRPGQPMGSQEQLEMGLEGSRDSGFSSTNNMYNVNSRRTSRYESNQDLISPGDGHSEPADSVFDSKLLYQARHGSLDNAYQQSQTNYGSLERHGKKKSNREYERKLSDTDAISEASAGTTSESPFVKRTSKSEFDLSSKGRERDHPSSSSSKDTEFPMASQSNYSVNSIGSSRPGRYNSRDSHSSRADSTSARTESTSSRLNSSSGQRLIELPVKHEAGSANHRPVRNADYYSSQSGWRDTSRPEPSPIVQSPTRPTINEQPEAGDSQPEGQCYSPRSFEGHRVPPQTGNPQVEHFLSIRLPDSAHGVQAISSKIVKISPHVEVSKPFEMKDFYKYSEKLRRQRLVEQYHQALVGSRPSSPSQLLSEGENHSLSHHFHHGHQHPPGNSHPAYRGHHGNSVSNSPFGSPLSSRHMVSNYPYPTHSHSYDSLGQPNSHGDSVLSSSVSTTTYGVSTTTSRVQYTVQTQGGRVLYKAQHQSSKQTHYQPPSTYKCEPVRSKEMHKGSHEAPAATGQSLEEFCDGTPQRQVHHQRQYSTPERSVVSPLNMTMSSFHLSPAGSLSKAFSNEMLEWYDGEGNQSPTSV